MRKHLSDLPAVQASEFGFSIDLERIEMAKMYTKDHEWLLFNGDTVTVGITAYAQEALGDLVYVDLPTIGAKASRGARLAEVESVKSVSEVSAPVDGVVTEVNAGLGSDPQMINRSPEDAGWLFKIRTGESSNPGWMNKSAYDQYLSTLH